MYCDYQNDTTFIISIMNQRKELSLGARGLNEPQITKRSMRGRRSRP